MPRDLNHFCLGCYTCIEDEIKCPYYEEKNAIMMEVEQADVLVMTTPNYCMAPSAPMKSLIDLTFTYWMSHKPRECMFGKRAVVISTTAGMRASKAIKPIATTLFYWGISSIYKYGVSVQAMNWKGVSDAKKKKIAKDVSRIARKLAGSRNLTAGNQLTNGKLYTMKSKVFYDMLLLCTKNTCLHKVLKKQSGKVAISESLYFCYHDQDAVMRMNDDNCDFGFYVESQERMAETVAYWLDFYDKQCFIRFAIVDHATGEAVGTVEGFGGEIGVLRIDLASSHERVACLLEILSLAKEHFRETFGNDYLVTKAISCAVERRKALEESGWEYIDTYRGYRDYYKISLIDN